MIINYIVEKCWCGATETIEVFNGIWYANNIQVATKLGKCINCKTIRTLSANNNWQINYDDTSIYNEISYRHKKSIDTILAYAQSGNLLEIGCSTGLVLLEIEKKRKDIILVGIDLNQKALEKSVDKTLNLIYTDIDGVNSQFDNIVAMHVIEHIPDLESFFDKLLKLTKKNTLVYFALPNIESLNYKMKKEYWGALNPLEHSWQFSPTTFKKVISHYLPKSTILCCKTSWVWKPRLVGFLGNVILSGDQIEIVIKI